MSALDLLVFVCSGLTCLRLLFYRRDGARFKRHVSAFAWLAIVTTGSLALAVLTGRLHGDQLPALAILVLMLFTLAIWHAKGNLAALFRLVHLSRRIP